MSNVVIAAAQVFSDKAVLAPYIHATSAVLSNPEVFEYSIFGEETRIREVTGGTASNYNPGKGFDNIGGTGGSVVWSSFIAPYDRKMTYPVDAIKEKNAILAGMTPSGVLINERNWANFGSEIDATTYSTIFSKVPAGNVKTVADFKVDSANVFGTLNRLENELINKGYRGKAFAFVRSSTYANIQTALVDKNGLANPTLLKVNPRLDGGLEVELEVLQYNNLFLVRVPDERLVNKILLLDGESAGQEAGGWAPDTANATFKQIEILVVPVEAAALSVRHLVTNFTVPASFLGMSLGKLNSQLPNISELYNGAVEFRNIGVDQTGDQFKYMNRIVYGTAVFETWKKTLLAVTA